ncbi:MAG: hypothetical protein RIR79_328 [Pseudomonadota bacterium]|jgi:tRNA pseudouridine32 synthase/23S rRNA pseudouridine746 synthase
MIDTIYVDESLIVLNKPAGLLCVPGRGADKQDCLSARVQIQFPDALIVHRLDMGTSGLVVMARTLGVQRHLGAQFANRQVEKRYTATVAGIVPEDCSIDLSIGFDWNLRPLRIIDPVHGKPSTTRLQVVHRDTTQQTTQVLLEPLTGRTHQLRLHLQAMGHPILGDALYAPLNVQAMAERLMLHAGFLAFTHPVQGDYRKFHAAH